MVEFVFARSQVVVSGRLRTASWFSFHADRKYGRAEDTARNSDGKDAYHGGK